jgi:hypothetical protein
MEIVKESINSKRVSRFIQKNEFALVYYTPDYLLFLESISPKSEIYYLCVTNENDKILGLIPVAQLSNETKGTIINSLPFFGSHGGVLFDDKVELKNEILKLLINEISNIKNDLLSITIIENPFNLMDESIMKDCDFECIDKRLGQFKFLFPNEEINVIGEKLMDSFHSKTRNAIRKGSTFSPKIKECYLNDTIRWIQKVHEKSISKINGSFKTIGDFENLFKFFPSPSMSRIFIAELNNEPVAGLIVLLYKNTVEYFTPVIEEEYKHTQLLSKLIFEIMIILSHEGYEIWNWGGTWESQKGVYRFKERFGSITKTYRYFNREIDNNIRQLSKKNLDNHFKYYYAYKF